MPDVYQHVTNLGLPWAVITTKWFICLFAEVLPIEVCKHFNSYFYYNYIVNILHFRLFHEIFKYLILISLQTTLRIWDCLFYEGNKIIFRVALTLIKRNQESLLACQEFSDLADCFKGITKDSIVLQCHEFMKVNLLFKFTFIIISFVLILNYIFRVFLKYLDHCLQTR